MTKTLAVVMDPIEHIQYKKDSTLSMLWEAQKRGYTLFYVTPDNLYSLDGKPYAIAQPLEVFQNEREWYRLSPMTEDLLLSDMTVILMRQDPPFNMNYIFNTYILELAEKQGAFVANKPRALRDINEKCFLSEFPQYAPPTLVSSNATKLKDFLQQHKDIVIKPLNAMGGASIFRLTKEDPNINVVIETMTEYGQRKVMAQRYIAAILEGDKRILLVNGEPIDYVLARFAQEGETRANLARGGRGVVQPINEHDRLMARSIGSVLSDRGVIFAGIDVIGECVTEINITSPTCIREVDEACSLNISGVLFDAIELRIDSKI